MTSTKLYNLLADILFGFSAFALARGIGIPQWVDLPSARIPADATDIGVFVFVACLLWRRG